MRGYLHEYEKRYKMFYEDAHKAHYYSATPYTSVRLAKYFIVYEKKLDSAKYYLDLGAKIYASKKNMPLSHKALLLRLNGRYYLLKKSIKKPFLCTSSRFKFSKK